MVTTRKKSQLTHALLGLGLCITTFTANAAFFDDVSEVVAADRPDAGSTILKRSVTSPDGRFTYVSELDAIFIFSRDVATGALTQVDIFDGASFPGGADSVRFVAEDILISPDGSYLYMAGTFGGRVEGDAPILSRRTVVKFQRDSESGALTFDNFFDFGTGAPQSIANLVLTDDGLRLLVALADGNVGRTQVHLVNTGNMESQFTLGDNPDLPASTAMLTALSPDNQTLYLAGPQANRGLEPVIGLAVIDVDRDNNRMSLRQSIGVEFFEPSETRVDISALRALSIIYSINPTDDGAYFYTLGRIRSNVENSGDLIEAVGVWRVEDDGSLSLVRTLDKQELVFDVVGGTGEFSFPTQLALSPGGNNFLYVAEDQSRLEESDLTVFARDSETGLLDFIDDNIGTTELDGAENIVFSPDARFINVIQSDSGIVTVMDTAVDRSVVISAANTQVLPGATASLTAIVSNDGPTDDYAVQLLIENPGDLTLATDDPNCSVLADGNVSCTRQLLAVGDQASFEMTAQTSQTIGSNTINATASSNKLDVDALNDTDSTIIVVTETPTEQTDAPAPVDDAPSGDDATPSSSSGGGGCTVNNARTHHDMLALLLISAGLLWRRKRRLVAVGK